jgi:hypothetical protein
MSSYIQIIGDQYNQGINARIDLGEEVIVPLNFAISDVRDFTKKTGSFSKSIKIPGTKENNRIFNNYFDVNTSVNDVYWQYMTVTAEANPGLTRLTQNPFTQVHPFQIGDKVRIYDGNSSRSVVVTVTFAQPSYIIVNLPFSQASLYDAGFVEYATIRYFDVNKRVNCVIVQDNQIVLDNAYLQLVDVNKTAMGMNKNENVIYTVLVKDTVADFYSAIANKNLQELNITDDPFFYTAKNVEDTFQYTVDDSAYKFLIPYSQDSTYNLTEFNPAIYVKAYFDRIFSAAGYSYAWPNSSFDLFKKLIIPFTGKKPDRRIELNDILIVEQGASSSFFIARNNLAQSLSVSNLKTPTFVSGNSTWYDLVNYFYINPWYFTPPDQGIQYKFEIEYDLFINNPYVYDIYPMEDYRVIYGPVIGDAIQFQQNNISTATMAYLTPTNLKPSIKMYPDNNQLVIGAGQTIYDWNYAVITYVSFGVYLVSSNNDHLFQVGDKIRVLNLNKSSASPATWTVIAITSNTVTISASAAISPLNQGYLRLIEKPSPDLDVFPTGATQLNLVKEKQTIILDNYPTSSFGEVIFNTGAMQYQQGSQVSTSPFIRWEPSIKAYLPAGASVSMYAQVTKIKISISPKPGPYGYNENIEINDFIPDIKQSDFIKSIFTMFNIFSLPDKNNSKRIILNHRDEFYDTGEQKDWSEKLCKDLNSIITFVPDLVAKKNIFTYADDDNDEVLRAYKKYTGETYGQVSYETSNEFVRDDKRNELIFAPTIFTRTNFNALVPTTLGLVPDYKPRIAIDGGAKICGNYLIINQLGKNANGENYIYPPNGQFGENYTIQTNKYPLAIHLNDDLSATSGGGNPTIDLNFAECDYYADLRFAKYYLFGEAAPANNLGNAYWQRTMNQLNSGLLYTCYLNLDSSDIANLSLNDNIYLENQFWNINKIVDYDANSNQPTKVELLKIDPTQSTY